jgi:oxysterol-binding protein-related protein 9/10/11
MPRASLLSLTTHVSESSSGSATSPVSCTVLVLSGLTFAVCFQCNWDTEDNAPRIDTQSLSRNGASGSNRSISGSPPGSSASSFRSAKLQVPNGLGSGGSRGASTVSIAQASTTNDANAKRVRVSYLTEQTSHHPPVSAFYISCPDKGLHARGYDQISAKFTGTSIKVVPGEHNLGIFITVERRNNETYQLTHPAAYLGGILRGALNISVGDQAYISCPETKMKVILNYYDEGWLGRSVNKVEGVIFRYDPDNDDKLKIRDVPEADILARLNGPWKEKINFTLGPKPFVSLACLHSCFVFARVLVITDTSVIGSTHSRGADHSTGPGAALGCSESLATGRAAVTE